jgi:hypothetical protein
MDDPVACLVRVRGALNPADWLARVGGLRLTTTAATPGGDGAAMTDLQGVLPGQLALLELLRTLHAHGVPLVSRSCTALGGPAST